MPRIIETIAVLTMMTGTVPLMAPASNSESAAGPEHWTVPFTVQAPLDGNSESDASSSAAYNAAATASIESAVVGGVTWPMRSQPTTVSVRFRADDGVWTAWSSLEADAEHAPDPGSAESRDARGGTVPIILGDADMIQVRATGADPLDGIRLDLVDPGDSPADHRVGEATSSAGVTDIGSGHPAELSSPTTVTATDETTDAVALAENVPQPNIHTRAGWGADESLRTTPPRYSSTIHAGWVHHTAGTNDYSAAEVPQIIRGIYIFHVQGRGWSDIGYNFLVDRFGRIWEGRYGGIERAVIGAHTGGFNTNTFGISAVGNFELVEPSTSLVESLSELTAWKLGIYGRDPAGRTPRLDGVDRPVVGGHRDASATLCPGEHLYDQLPYIRVRARDIVVSNQIGGDTAIPVAGDVDGDGADDIGWFEGGRWAFRLADQSIRQFSFGRGGDIPLVGDFDADGKDEPGIFRDGRWHLRDDASAGVAWRAFTYGLRGDVPLVGQWPGTVTVGVGIVRGNAWHFRSELSGGPAEWWFRYGRSTDVPMVGDWIGDGAARPAVVRDGKWYFATSIQEPSTEWSYRFGWSEDSRVVVDSTGDGVQTAAVTRGITWHLRESHAAQSNVTAIDFSVGTH